MLLLSTGKHLAKTLATMPHSPLFVAIWDTTVLRSASISSRSIPTCSSSPSRRMAAHPVRVAARREKAF